MSTLPLPPSPNPGLAAPRLRGWLGQWSDRVQALALLVLLACAGALTGIGISTGEGERLRDGVNAGSAGLRATLAEAPAALSLPGEDRRRPDLSGGDRAWPATMLPPPSSWAPVPVALAFRGWSAPDTGPAVPRAGHAARMPTGPPSALSV